MSQDEYNDYTYDPEYDPELTDGEKPAPRAAQGGRHERPSSSGSSSDRRPASRSASSGHTRSGDAHRRPSSSRPDPRRAPSKKRRKRRRRRKSRAGKTVLIVVLALVAALIVAGVLLFSHFYGLMNTVGRTAAATPTPAVAEITPAPVEESFSPTPEPTPTPTPEPLTEEELARLAEVQLLESLQEDAEEIIYSDSVYNILLIGVDDRDESSVGRCDALILLSINKDTKTIWLTSILRDAQVTIPDWGKGHLNWTTNFGGIDLLLRTLEYESNYAIHVDNYALVNFVDFVAIANKLAPITVDLTVAEAQGVNKSVREVARILDVSRPYIEEKDGTFTLTNGLQILGYCRERHVGGNHQRGVRQRDALMQMWNNARSLPLSEQYKLMELIMSNITTDLTPGKCASLLLMAPSLINYEIKATPELPVEGAYWKGRDEQGLGIYNIDFRVNRNFIRATIYNEPMTAADLTSAWTGAKVLVMEPTA